MTATTWRRYHSVAISLHWLIAIAILTNILAGWWMHEAIDQASTQELATSVYQWHKSLGLTVLFFSLLRLGWRLAHPPAANTVGAAWERRAAQLTHWAFYALMLGIPLSGWLYVSAQWRGDQAFSVATVLWGWVEIPHLLGLDQAAHGLREQLANASMEAHEILAQLTLVLLALHVGAALKHHFVSRDHTLRQMSPQALRAELLPPPYRRPLLGCAVVVLGLASLTLLATWQPLAAQSGVITPSALQNQWQQRTEHPLAAWTVNTENSRLSFSGEHDGDTFEGEFGRWEADIRLDPAQPEQGRILARIDTSSAQTGVGLQERTLRKGEWFNVDQYPYAYFSSSAIRSVGGEQWEVEGQLEIKQRPIPVKPLRLRLGDNELQLEVNTEIRRDDADLGMGSDPGADYVSMTIPVQLTLSATAP
nr:cytochrome b/b6 domain-containing protein [Oceanococcus sp. HetDA_MAG_MS8]